MLFVLCLCGFSFSPQEEQVSTSKKSVGTESLIELTVKRENFVVLCNGCSALHLPGCLESSAHG